MFSSVVFLVFDVFINVCILLCLNDVVMFDNRVSGFDDVFVFVIVYEILLMMMLSVWCVLFVFSEFIEGMCFMFGMLIVVEGVCLNDIR